MGRLGTMSEVSCARLTLTLTLTLLLLILALTLMLEVFCTSVCPIVELSIRLQIGSLCVYLGSDESGYMTGQVQVLDGGAGLSVV